MLGSGGLGGGNPRPHLLPGMGGKEVGGQTDSGPDSDSLWISRNANQPGLAQRMPALFTPLGLQNYPREDGRALLDREQILELLF